MEDSSLPLLQEDIDRKRIFDSPYIPNNIRYNDGKGIVAILTQNIIHFYCPCYHHMRLLDLNWLRLDQVEINLGQANMNAQKKDSEEMSVMNRWIDRRSFIQNKVSFEQFEWFPSVSSFRESISSSYSVVLLSNHQLFIFKTNNILSNGSYHVDNALTQGVFDHSSFNLAFNSGEIIFNSFSDGSKMLEVFSFVSLIYQKRTLLITSHAEMVIKIWEFSCSLISPVKKEGDKNNGFSSPPFSPFASAVQLIQSFSLPMLPTSQIGSELPSKITKILFWTRQDESCNKENGHERNSPLDLIIYNQKGEFHHLSYHFHTQSAIASASSSLLSLSNVLINDSKYLGLNILYSRWVPVGVSSFNVFLFCENQILLLQFNSNSASIGDISLPSPYSIQSVMYLTHENQLLTCHLDGSIKQWSLDSLLSSFFSSSTSSSSSSSFFSVSSDTTSPSLIASHSIKPKEASLFHGILVDSLSLFGIFCYVIPGISAETRAFQCNASLGHDHIGFKRFCYFSSSFLENKDLFLELLERILTEKLSNSMISLAWFPLYYLDCLKEKAFLFREHRQHVEFDSLLYDAYQYAEENKLGVRVKRDTGRNGPPASVAMAKDQAKSLINDSDSEDDEDVSHDDDDDDDDDEEMVIPAGKKSRKSSSSSSASSSTSKSKKKSHPGTPVNEFIIANIYKKMKPYMNPPPQKLSIVGIHVLYDAIVTLLLKWEVGSTSASEIMELDNSSKKDVLLEFPQGMNGCVASLFLV
jgi:hypothetical protein